MPPGKKSLARSEANRFHPARCDTIKSVVDHEMGHQIDKLIGARSDPKIIALFDDMQARGGIETQRLELSGYGGYSPTVTEKGKALGEFIAEGWAEYMNNPQPRPMAKAIGERLEELYNEKRRSGSLNV